MDRRTFNTAALATAATMMVPGVAAASDDCTACARVEIPVTIGGVDGSIVGVLSVPPGATSVQVLVHGWTYNRLYFDSPYEPDRYSYARAANRAGYATLILDRPGSGCSIHPLSLFTGVDVQVDAVHRAIQALRSGNLGHEFDKVILVGHSLGSIISATTAGRHPDDVDALITTAYSHAVNSVYAFPTILGRDYLAAGDKQFASLKLDPLYMTSIPGARYTFYRFQYNGAPIEGIGGRDDTTTGAYTLLNADPGMVAADDKYMRDTGTLTQFATALPTLLINETVDFNKPVLAVNGDHEPFFCGVGASDCTSNQGIVDFESQYYAPGTKVHGYSVPGTGHDIHLEHTSGDATRVMLEFCEEYVGHGSGKTGTIPGAVIPCEAPEQTAPPLTAVLANTAFVNLVYPVINLFDYTVSPLPGLGDGANPVPVVSEFLTEINKIITRLLGGLTSDLTDIK